MTATVVYWQGSNPALALRMALAERKAQRFCFSALSLRPAMRSLHMPMKDTLRRFLILPRHSKPVTPLMHHCAAGAFAMA